MRDALPPPPGIDICLTDEPADDFKKQLESTLFGSDGLRYRKLNGAASVDKFRPGVFVEARDDGRLIGTYGVQRHRLRIDGQSVTGSYRGLLTVRPERSGKGIGRHLIEAAMSHLQDEAAGRLHFSWSCIEAGNFRALHVLESLGAVPVGELRTVLIYRQSPSPADALVERPATLADTDAAVVEPSDGQATWCLEENGSTVASAGIVQHGIDLTAGGSLAYRGYAGLVRWIPPARRRFDPSALRFLRLTNPQFDDPNAMTRLIDGLMHQHGVHMAMLALDPRDKRLVALEDANYFGRFSEMTAKSIIVMALPLSSDRTLIDAVRSVPLALVPPDL